MTTMTIDIGSLIVCSPDVRGARPRIAGTGVTVQRIVGWYKLGLTAMRDVVAKIERFGKGFAAA